MLKVLEGLIVLAAIKIFNCPSRDKDTSVKNILEAKSMNAQI